MNNNCANCCICYEHGNVPCRNGKGCTAIMCMTCVAKMYLRHQDNCPICRRLWFQPDFHATYASSRQVNQNYIAMWSFSAGLVHAQVRMLHDGHVCKGMPLFGDMSSRGVPQGQGCRETGKEYAYDIGSIVAEIDDDDKISVALTEIEGDHFQVNLADSSPLDHITQQLQQMNIPYTTIQDTYDYFSVRGKGFKQFIKKGRFF